MTPDGGAEIEGEATGTGAGTGAGAATGIGAAAGAGGAAVVGAAWAPLTLSCSERSWASSVLGVTRPGRDEGPAAEELLVLAVERVG